MEDIIEDSYRDVFVLIGILDNGEEIYGISPVTQNDYDAFESLKVKTSSIIKNGESERNDSIS